MSFISIYVLIILLIYLSAFFIQNLKTYFSVKQSIRGKSGKLSLSLALSICIYGLIFILVFMPEIKFKLGFVQPLELNFIQIFGLVVITVALFVGLAALYEMKNSWRVGIKYDQKTNLVTSGIYSVSRNPYFLSYDLLFIGIFLVFPVIILFILTLVLMITFHRMIVEEEQYLEGVQGQSYINYKKRTGRYFLGV